MHERRSTLLFVILFMAITAGLASAQGLLGERYAGIEFGLTRPGDKAVREVDESLISAIAGFNLPVNPNLDASLSVSHGWFKGEGTYYNNWAGGYESYSRDVDIKTITASGRVAYHMTPEGTVDPFIEGGPMFVDTRIKDGDNDSEFGFGVGAGVEVALSDMATVCPAVMYAKVGELDDIGVGLTFNSWFSPTAGVILEGVYWTDDGDIGAAVGMTIGIPN